ncbi:sugar phosphate isomerase/epimerase family protein [Gorillibacterium timonense]|uniref:sugar phosphate isomerase/epimerase family protein n=1 Tax=Gorillibacterium timonense TaxID=1689269 RepID=UPI00071D561A|nr:sugar phosphate isomerase/epimerase family protein [Gorillibacterium timonense]
MKTSLSIWSVHKSVYAEEMDNAAFIEFAAEAGAQGVELLSIFWKEDGQEAERIAAALERTGLALACFSACNNLAVTGEERRRAEVSDIIASVDRAALFGAKVVRVFSGDKEESVTYEAAKGWIVEGLIVAAAYAESKGITLCLENHGLFAGKAEQVLEVIREVGSASLKSTFDTGNFLLVDENPSEAVVKLKDRIAHVHLKDFAPVEEGQVGTFYTSLGGKRFSGQVPGEGVVDLPFILGELRDHGYAGWLSVEYEGDEEQKEGSKRSIEHLSAILQHL